MEQVTRENNLDDWKTSILSVDEDKIKEDEFAQNFGYYSSLYSTSVAKLPTCHLLPYFDDPGR